jgi:trehalose/maltose hydrolase-like predicted phosphorylase
MFPALLALHPEIAAPIVNYRFETLAAARRNAALHGLKGAFFSWTSELNGDETTNCYGTPTEPHIDGDVALAQWQYYEATGDNAWLMKQGWPVLEGIAEFWASRTVPGIDGGYNINDVQASDEYAAKINDDAFTDAGAAVALRIAIQAAQIVGAGSPSRWSQMADGLAKSLPYDAGNNVHLEYDHYQGVTIKQADVVMLTYPLQFPMSAAEGANDLNYYSVRSDPGGPAMTDSIHSIDASILNIPGCSAYTYMLRSYEPFLREPFAGLSELRPPGGRVAPQGEDPNRPAFNFLTGSGGFLQIFLYGFSGLRWGTASIELDPSLPPQLQAVTLKNLSWQGRNFTVMISPEKTQVLLESGPPMPIRIRGKLSTLREHAGVSVATRRPDLDSTGDLARCRPVKASSFVPGEDPIAAVDGSSATNWIPAQPAADLTVDLGSAIQVEKVVVIQKADSSAPFWIEISTDEVHWDKVVKTQKGGDKTGVFTIIPKVARYVRLVYPGGTHAVVPVVSQFNVYAQ